MTDRVRLRSTALLAAVLSLPTLRALLAYDIGVTTAGLRIVLAIAVAIAAVAAVASLLGRVPPPGGPVAEEAAPAEDEEAAEIEDQPATDEPD